jgi:hypothetical protein
VPAGGAGPLLAAGWPAAGGGGVTDASRGAGGAVPASRAVLPAMPCGLVPAAFRPDAGGCETVVPAVDVDAATAAGSDVQRQLMAARPSASAYRVTAHRSKRETNAGGGWAGARSMSKQTVSGSRVIGATAAAENARSAAAGVPAVVADAAAGILWRPAREPVDATQGGRGGPRRAVAVVARVGGRLER